MMDIGKKLRQARLEAGLSQRQLCADVITRNMLSLIENGAARPSMDTLAFLAKQLGKPIYYFLEEDMPASGNVSCLLQAKKAYAAGALTEAERALQAYKVPDAVHDDEYWLLQVLILLRQAEDAEDRPAYAETLLDSAKSAMEKTCYATRELEQRRRLLLARVSRDPVTLLPDDRPLLYRAEMALKAGDVEKCVALLTVCEQWDCAKWHYLRAEAAFCAEDHALAEVHYRQAETEYPKKCIPRLEQCYCAMGDYKMAYEYARKQKESSSIL